MKAVTLLIALLLLAGCAGAPRQTASTPPPSPSPSPLAGSPSQSAGASPAPAPAHDEVVLYAEAPTAVGENVQGRNTSYGVTPDPVEFRLGGNATRLRVTATWTPSIPTADALYVYLQGPQGPRPLASARGGSPLVVDAGGAFAHGTYSIGIFPDNGHATNGENVTLRVQIDYAS